MKNYTEEERKELHREFSQEFIPYRRKAFLHKNLAEETIAFCHEKEIETVLTKESLEAGMNNLLTWSLSPKDYLDFVFAANAALIKWFQTHGRTK